MEKNFEPLKKAFKQQGWIWEDNEKLFQNINVKNKDDMWLYNYSDKVLVKRNHPSLIRCRGLVVKSDGTIINYPFDRFFNDFQEEFKTIIEWDTARIEEKVDGSLLCVFWNGEDWEVTTRGSFYPSEKASTDFGELFRKHFVSFDKLSKEICYMFELITEDNRIVTWYDEESVYLIGARDTMTLNEVSTQELDEWAKTLGVKRPKRYHATNVEGCKELFEKFKDDDEGLVITDNSFNRLKIKQDSYFKLSKIKMLKGQDLFEFILGVTEIDEEYLVKCPEVIQEVDKMRTYWDKVYLEILAKFGEIKESIGLEINDHMTRKAFALEAQKYPYKQILFALLDKKEVNSLRLKWERVERWIKNG